MIELGAVVFWLVVMPAVGAPLQFQHRVASLPDCLDELERFLSHPNYTLLADGGRVQAGCIVHVPPTRSH